MQTALVRCAGVPGMGRGRCDVVAMWCSRLPSTLRVGNLVQWSSNPLRVSHNSWRLIPICASSRDCATLIFRLSVPLSFWSLHFFALSWAINQLQPFGSKNQRECRGSHSEEQGAIWPKQWCFGKKILVVRCCWFNAFFCKFEPLILCDWWLSRWNHWGIHAFHRKGLMAVMETSCWCGLPCWGAKQITLPKSWQAWQAPTKTSTIWVSECK